MSYDKYIGLPFKHRGRTLAGVDCYGLVSLILRDKWNIIMPEYEYAPKWTLENKSIIVDEANKADKWKIVTDAYRPLDLILFYASTARQIVSHIGVFIEENKFIHIEEGQRSEMTRLNYHWINRVYKAVRYTGEVHK